MLLRRVWGDITAGKVTVEISTNYNTKNQKTLKKTGRFGQSGIDGRLRPGKWETARAPSPTSRSRMLWRDQLALNARIVTERHHVLAQQLAGQADMSSFADFLQSGSAGGGAGNRNGVSPFLVRSGGAVGYQPVIQTLSEGAMFSATAGDFGRPTLRSCNSNAPSSPESPKSTSSICPQVPTRKVVVEPAAKASPAWAAEWEAAWAAAWEAWAAAWEVWAAEWEAWEAAWEEAWAAWAEVECSKPTRTVTRPAFAIQKREPERLALLWERSAFLSHKAGQNIQLQRLEAACLVSLHGNRSHHRVVRAEPKWGHCERVTPCFSASSVNRTRNLALAATPPPTQSVVSPVLSSASSAFPTRQSTTAS